MNFIIDNYLWFGIAGVILLMALIGFLAEKTNFIVGNGDKPKKVKKSKKKKDEPNEFMESEEIVEEPSIEEESTVETVELPLTEELPVEEVPTTDEVLDFSNITTSSEPQIESAPLNVTDTWAQPVVEQPVVTETGEDLTQPFGEPIKTPSAPVVEEAKQPGNTTDEDIWKF